MSQHDQVIANQAGAAFRSDINDVLAALFSNSSGLNTPSTTVAYQFWADTTTGLMKQRNAANSAWITLGTLASTNWGLLPLAGGTMTGNLLFTDATYDIGASGATRPRDLHLSRNAAIGGNVNITGTVKAGGTLAASYVGVGTTHGVINSGSTWGFVVDNSHGSGPWGLSVNYTGAAPNGTSQDFFYAADTGGQRHGLRSNGGRAGYTANDVNLSDERVKPVFEDWTDELLNEYEGRFVNVRRGRYKYADQTHNDWNYGRSANSVAEQFPELAEVWNPTKTVRTFKLDEQTKELGWVTETVETPAEERLLAEYPNDTTQIGEALLVRALKRIKALEEKMGL